MIILGDTANNYHMGVLDEVPPNEFVCWTKKEKITILKRFKIRGRHICWTNKTSTVYQKDDTFITIHDAERFPVFKYFKKYAFIREGVDVISPMMFTYAWAQVKSLFKSVDVTTWEKNVITHTYLYRKYIQYAPKATQRRVDMWAQHLTFFGAMGWKQDYLEHDYKPFDTYTEDSLLKLFRYNGTTSAWRDILLSTSNSHSIPSRVKFNLLTEEGKLGAVMERLYVDCSNEYIFPELIFHEVSGLSTTEMFKHTIMNRCSMSANSWLSFYIITHYDDIMEEFDPLFVDQLEDAVEWQMLTKVI